MLAAAGSATTTGAHLLTGGAATDDPGWFVRPALLEDVPANHPLSCDEVFGPTATLHAVSALDEEVAMANNVPQGLAAGVYTRDLAASDTLEAGLVKVNSPTTGVDFYLPFGGEKASSVGGRAQGKAAQDFFTSLHTVALAPGEKA